MVKSLQKLKIFPLYPSLVSYVIRHVVDLPFPATSFTHAPSRPSVNGMVGRIPTRTNSQTFELGNVLLQTLKPIISKCVKTIGKTSFIHLFIHFVPSITPQLSTRERSHSPVSWRNGSLVPRRISLIARTKFTRCMMTDFLNLPVRHRLVTFC